MPRDLPIAYRFNDPSLADQALTHRSAGNSNNERLEFLGDGVLNFIVADLLYQAFYDASEGDLSRQRARLVRKETLADIARQLGLGELLTLGPGESRSGGFRRDSILGDAVEALLGAVYLDGGFDAAAALVREWYAPRIAALPPAEELKDAKTRLQEALQGRSLPLPDYELVGASGPDHARSFDVRCRVHKLGIEVTAKGSSRRRAEQAAAQFVLARLDPVK